MNKKTINALLLALASTSTYAGTMGVVVPEKLLIFEAGVAYSHAFYKNDVVFPESYTLTIPSGFSINPKDFYPQDFVGGYFGLSFYMQDWLFNARYNMYGTKDKQNTLAETDISLSPVRLSLTVDRVWGDINQFSYGLGFGATIENLNRGEALVTVSTLNPPSESVQGRTRIDPVVEGFAMYRFANNFGIKFNLEYQIPVNNLMGNGDLNLNLGVNYAFPV